MKAYELYENLENDFINSALTDEWAKYMSEIESYVCNNFKKRSMGLVCDFTDNINKVYTAVFPDEKVMEKILDERIEEAMLFVHHPAIWDIKRPSGAFHNIPVELLESFKRRKISIYNLHVPLDNFGEYSTSKVLAEALDFEIEKPFAKYFGSQSGVICKSKIDSVEKIHQKVSELVKHDVKLYQYGNSKIRSGKIAVIAGGGNDKEFVLEMLENDVNTLVTGITCKSSRTEALHSFEQENKINIIGATHYSTEKFACIEICKYFNKLGLPSEFLEGEAIMEDM